MKYPPLNEQLKEFKVYILLFHILGGVTIMRTNNVKTTDSYNHNELELHHFIKEQQYYRYPYRYKGKQKLILLPKKLHADLHSAMSDERFEQKYGIERDLLLYRKEKTKC